MSCSRDIVDYRGVTRSKVKNFDLKRVAEKLLELAQQMLKNQYGEYLVRIVEE